MVRFLEVNKHVWSLEAISYFVAHLITPWNGVLLEKLTGSQLIKKWSTFYETWRFMTAFKSAPPPIPILSHIAPLHASHPTSWRSVLILSSHLRLGLPSGLFPSGFPTRTLFTPLLSPILTLHFTTPLFGAKKIVYLLLTLYLCMDKCLFLPFYFNCYKVLIFVGYKNYYHEHFLTNFMSFNAHLIVPAFKPSWIHFLRSCALQINVLYTLEYLNLIFN